MRIKINKNVPVPPKRNAKSFPFMQMKIGDSFFTKHRQVQQASAYYAAKHRVKFTCRKEGIGKNAGMRCWRIA